MSGAEADGIVTRMTDSAKSIRVEREVAAPAETVWALVSDVTRMGEWSPETTRGQWLGSTTGPAVGARFKGTNQLGSRKWQTVATVVECEPGRRFAFDVKGGPFKVARWSYTFEPTDGGCRVVEEWDDHRGPVLVWLAPYLSGTKDRAARNRDTMTETLARLAVAAEKK